MKDSIDRLLRSSNLEDIIIALHLMHAQMTEEEMIVYLYAFKGMSVMKGPWPYFRLESTLFKIVGRGFMASMLVTQDQFDQYSAPGTVRLITF